MLRISIKISILFVLLVLLIHQKAYSNTPLDSVINLKEVVVVPTKYKQIVSKTKPFPITVSAKSNINSILSLVPLSTNKTYRIAGVEFYFSLQGSSDKYNGFYVRPLLYTSKNFQPARNLLDKSAISYANKKIRNKFYFDLLDYNIVLKDMDSFFIGFSFPDKNEDVDLLNFNMKMGHAKLKNVVTYAFVDKDIQHKVKIDIDGEVTLKYKLYYIEEMDN